MSVPRTEIVHSNGTRGGVTAWYVYLENYEREIVIFQTKNNFRPNGGLAIRPVEASGLPAKDFDQAKKN